MRITSVLLCLCLAAPVAGVESPEPRQLTLLSFNLWGAGANEGKSIDETVAVLRAANADVIGLQETRAEGDDCLPETCPGGGENRAAELASALGYYHYTQARPSAANWYGAILSRWPIVEVMPNDLGVVIDLDGWRVHAFNIHNTDFPYQPYQLLGIPYGDQPNLDSAEAAIAAAHEARSEGLELLLEDVSARDGADLEVIFGDFNEPSHRDWSGRAAAAGRHPVAVAFPFTRALEAEGFIDGYRAVHPDEMAKPGYTWTPITSPADPADHHDRIDYVFIRGAAVSVTSAEVMGEASGVAEIVVTPWPSDHRAVRVTAILDGADP